MHEGYRLQPVWMKGKVFRLFRWVMGLTFSRSETTHRYRTNGNDYALFGRRLGFAVSIKGWRAGAYIERDGPVVHLDVVKTSLAVGVAQDATN